MANKRIPDLDPIYSTALVATDLLLLEDMSIANGVSKKLALSELSTYLLLTSRSGSLYGTASWALNAVSSSWAPYQVSASYSNTSSWSWQSISASHALAALSASYARNSSYAITASYALTSSVQLVYSSAFSDYAKSASYLIYTPGTFNGTASYALSTSSSISTTSASYLRYDPTISNGTSSYAINTNQSTTSSFLNFIGNPNGTSSYSMKALVADTVTSVTTISNEYIFREFGSYDCDILTVNTASIGAFIVTNTSSGRALIIEAFGDIRMVSTSSLSQSGSLTLNITNADGAPVSYDLDISTYQNFATASLYPTASYVPQITSSIITSAYLRGKVTGYTSDHFSASVFLNGPIQFYTGSRPIRMTIKVNTDNFARD